MTKPAHTHPPSWTKLIIGLALIVFGAYIVFWGHDSVSNARISSFDECIAAGNPVLKTYPGQCITKDGRTFVQIIPGVNSFEECAQYYPVMESYPEQCRTPDGRNFVRTISSGCTDDSTCQLGYFCKGGLCTEFSPQKSCDVDTDCQLINVTQRFACCYAGQCDAIDYSNSKWMAVNAEWFNENRTATCPSQESCGPAPGCATQTDTRYRATCSEGLCQKTYIQQQ